MESGINRLDVVYLVLSKYRKQNGWDPISQTKID